MGIPTSDVSRWVRLHRQDQQELNEGGITRRELEAETAGSKRKISGLRWSAKY